MLRLVLLLVCLAATARSDELPAWTSLPARFETKGVPAFLAAARSGEFGPADFKSEQAEGEAAQRIGELVADWQEAALRCAKQESLAREVKAKSGSRGLTVDFEITTEIDVALYRLRVVDRAYEGKTILVLVKHELAPLIAGIVADTSRPEALRVAVRTCGEKAFHEVAARTR